MLDFGTSVAVNNLIALRAFYTFLFNYTLHEKPSWLEKKGIPYLKSWVEKRALATMDELLNSETAKAASVSLNDVSGDFFAVLYICQHPELVVELSTGNELFLLLSQMGLEFEKVKHPRDGTKYVPQI